MIDRENVIKGLEYCGQREFSCSGCQYYKDESPRTVEECLWRRIDEAITLLKEQEKKQITLHKKHVITWGRNDEFSMRNLYEKICETLLDEGELFIERTDDHEKVDFVFYVVEGR